MQWVRSLWAEISTPSGAETDYQWALTAIGHAVLGAALASVVGAWALAIYALKEASDLRRGGRWQDSAVDLAFVAIGCAYGPPAWPVAVFAAVGVGLTVRNVWGD